MFTENTEKYFHTLLMYTILGIEGLRHWILRCKYGLSDSISSMIGLYFYTF